MSLLQACISIHVNKIMNVNFSSEYRSKAQFGPVNITNNNIKGDRNILVYIRNTLKKTEIY